MYVDDIVITGNDMADISSLKSFLHDQFHTKYFLGVEVMRSKREIFLSKRKYVLNLLSETGKLAAKPCHSLILLEKANCLKTLRDIEGWLGSRTTLQ